MRKKAVDYIWCYLNCVLCHYCDTYRVRHIYI